MKTEQPTLDYNERGMVLKKKAMAVELKKIDAVYERFDKHAHGIQRNVIDAVNDAREIGIHFQTLCGHEQMDLDFWNTHCKGKCKLDFESAKMFISVARKMPKKAKTLEEAVPHVQQVLIADGILQLPERTGEQKRSTVSVMQKFFAEITIVRGGFKKALREKPMEQWEQMDIDTFLSETEWLAVERNNALRLRGNQVVEI